MEKKSVPYTERAFGSDSGEHIILDAVRFTERYQLSSTRRVIALTQRAGLSGASNAGSTDVISVEINKNKRTNKKLSTRYFVPIVGAASSRVTACARRIFVPSQSARLSQFARSVRFIAQRARIGSLADDNRELPLNKPRTCRFS